MENLSKIKSEELERRLRVLEEELEELEEEKSFVLKQTGLHISGGKVKQYEAQTQSLKQSISELREKLKQ
ncbi:hypothetical protein UF75_5401 [Desulfosporosinus sp. I2]|uniref:hypothetical protein n=1 Tax=Desulfosporosinus sp. I2 TaxID=1617025 RepID=UPI0005EFC807|nr:hypothetical protein [Desulfosporosinus sp. I2]KJR44214.1 hypothetical protein UF75_5401 [Desulfosporosinus sp. I2]